MQENNFIMLGVVGVFFFECSAQSHQLCSVDSPNGFVRFEQLIIHDTKLIPPNTQYEFFFYEYSVWLSMLKYGHVVPMISSSLVIIVDPFFIPVTI